MNEINIPWLNQHDVWFPSTSNAMVEPNGLLAVGGDLSPQRLLAAYQNGIFPWFDDDQPILWWSPDPRMVLVPDQVKISRSLAKSIRNKGYQVSFDRDFDQVIDACSEARNYAEGTWICQDMKNAYCELHAQGHAHSVECWLEDKLVGGLYGVNVGQVFFGESMFSRANDASKVALVTLCQQLAKAKFPLIDCQIASEHLTSLGAFEISRKEFETVLSQYCNAITPANCWDMP